MLAYETEALATKAETKAFRVETEAKTKTFSLAAEARPRHLKFQPRRDQAEALLQAPQEDRGHIPGMSTIVIEHAMLTRPQATRPRPRAPRTRPEN